MPDIKGNNQQIYDFLSSKGASGIGSNADEFQKFMEKDSNRRQIYDYLSSIKAQGIGDSYDAFSSMVYASPETAEEQTAAPEATSAPAPAGTSSSRGRMSPGSRTSAFNERVRQREAARAGTATPATDLATEDWAQQVAASRGRRNAARQMPAGPSEPEPAQDAQPADDARTKAAEEARKRQEEVDALNAELEKYSETSDLVDEYERRLDENKNSLDPGSRKVRENNDWLYAHRDAYREAKSSKDMQEYNRIKRRIYDLTVTPALEDVNAKGEALNQEIWDLNTGPANKEKTQRISELQDAKEIYNMAWQELKQGSKYDVGYENGNGAGTAIGQFVGQAARNVDRGSFTLGLSEGLANKRARDIGDKYNAAINAAKDGLGYSDKDVDNLLKSINETGSGLEKVVGELEAEESSLNAMEATYKDMVKSGASQGDLAAYERQYNQKVKEYNKKVKEQYQPLRDRYDADKGKYDELMSAVDKSISDSLTPGEQEILNAYDALINARAVTADYASTAAKSGAGFEQTLEFMVDFWLTKGIDKAGTKVATKIARDRAIKKFGVEAVANMTVKPGIGLKMATDLGTSVARTAAMPTRFMQTAGEQLTQLDQTPYNGKDALGRYQFSRSKGNAYANAGVEDFIEYWSEGFGEYFGAAEAALFRNVTKAAPRTAIGQTLKSYRGSVGRYLDNAKFNGQFNETVEEVIGSGLNALTGWMSGDRLGDQEALNDFFKKDNLATLTVSFLPLSAIGAATNLNSYHQMKRRYNESVERLTPFIESGAISRKELEGLADNMKEMTPEQVKDRIVKMTDRAREANGGRLPQDFAKSIMGYLEGTFSMSLRNEEWEDSKEKMAIVNAYTANYANPVARDAWDVNQNERTARNAALEAGFTEEDLDNDAWMLGQEAVETRLEGQEEKADVLMDYATAKAQAEGLRRGYAAQTAAMEEQYDANVRQNLDMNGTVTTATLNVDGKQTEVFIVQKDATVNPDGTVSTPTGDGLVAYRNTEKGAVRTAKADQFSNASTTSTDSVIESANGALRQARETYFQSMQDTPSLKGQSEALANVVGQNVVIDDHEGVYQPVKVERLTEGGSRVVISGDKKAMQGIAERIGIRIPTTPYLEAPVERLFPLLSTEEDGSLTTFDPNPKNEAGATESTATANAQPAPAAQSEDLADQKVKAMIDGEVKDVHVLGVNEGKVMYEVLDENGNVVKTTNKTEADFARAMQEAQAPAAQEETPAPAAEENVPKQGTIPRDEKGRKVYDAEGVSVEDALDDLYNTPGLTEEKVDQYIADRVAKAEAARNPEMGDMTPEEWGAATMEANRVADFWSAMKQAAEARKAAPAPAPAQEQEPAREEKASPKPRTAAPAPAGEPTRIDSRRKIVSRARDWQKRTKVKVHLVDSIEDVHDQEAREALEDGRALTGWFSKDTGEVEIYLPNITNTAVLDRTFVHEVVSHKGLEGLLGEEGYAALCDRVWNELMTPEEQQEFMNYNRHLRGTEEFLHRAAADEYIARLSENLDFPDNRSLFQKLVDMVMDWLNIQRDVAGIEKRANETAATETMDRTVLYALLEDSLKRYEAETTRGMRDAEAKREIGSDTGNAMETGEGNKGQTRFSMKSIVTGGGLNVIENDGKGNVAFVTTDGRKFDAEHPITADDLKALGNTVMAHMMKDAREISRIDPQKEMRIWQAYADQLNAFLQKGVAKDGLDGADRLKALWQWEVENSVYRSVAPNSDEQYKYSLDITRVCKKNEATIKAISAMQRQLGYGITPGQVMDVYLSAIEEGYQVPCPVCYVFSRYINNGVVATIAINGQRRWGADLVDPSTLTEEQKQERIAMWKKRLDEQEAFNEQYKKQIAQAKKDCTDIIDEIDRLSEQITSGKLKGKERAAAEKRVKLLDNRYRAAFDLVSQSALTQWIKQFAIRQTKNGYAPAADGKKYDLWEDTFQGFPEEYALDLRLTAETIEKYPAIQRLRKARGAAGGKEIHFASNNDVGDIPMMLGADNSVNFYQKAVNARTQKERDYFLGKARERFQSAHKYAQQQSLRGGQRMWSWSDNIERLAPDVFVNLLQLQMLGGALQSYSKQLEGVNLVANMDGYVNGSLMGYGKGWTELKPEDVEYVEVNGEKVPVLSHDIKDVVEEKMPEGVVMRERYLAKKGAPVTTVDGKMVTLLFDDVVGIDAYGRDVDGKHLKGLFDLNGELDKAGNILVGMNDTHIIAAMADDRVFFIIPWHASGNSVHMVQQMLRGLGVDTMVKDYTDYTNVQEEKDMAGKKKGGEEAEFADEMEEVSKEEKIEETEPIRQEILDFWEDHKKEDEYRSGIGPIPSGKDGKLSDEQRRYRRLRDAIFDGAVADLSEEDRKAITDDAFLSQVLRKVNAVVDAKEMTAGDKKFIYPYEYWNENSTYDTADENGERYLEYCRRLGYKPKFVGKLDSKAKKDFGNFADYKGYWKLLIDRRMYGVNGRFQDLDPVTTDRYDPRTVDPEWTAENFPLTTVADDPGAERIAARAIEKESRTFKGGVPKPNYEGDIRSAARKYEMVSKLVDVKPGKGKNTMFRVADEMRDGEASADPQVSEGGATMFRERTAPAPQKTQEVYKLMRLGEDGKLYPLFIDSASPIELKKWYDADSPALKDVEKLPSDTYTGIRDIKDDDGNKIGEEEYRYGVYIVDNETGEATSLADFKAAHKGDKTFSSMRKNPSKAAINWATDNGMRWIKIEEKKTAQKRYGGSNRAYYNYGINGSGGVGTFAMRPGWHAGSLQSMRQIGKGSGKNLRDDRFVWVKGYVPADIDYNEEAQGNPDKDIPTHIPENGYYLKATNANAEASQADRIGWYVAGSFYPERIMSDSEAKSVIDQWNADHPNEQVKYDWPRESGKVFNAETMQLEDENPEPEGPDGGGTRFREEVNRDAARVKETVNERAHDLSANRGLGFIKQDIADGKEVTKKNPGITIRLGLPSGSLLAGGVRNQPMVVSEYDLMEASGNGYGDAHHYHPYDLGDLNDLATLINHPVAVFRDKRNPYNRVLLLDRKGRITGREQSRKFDYVAAIASVPVYDANGKRSFVNRILTVFPAESKWKEFYAQLKDLADGNAEVGQDVMWVDNKKISPWVKGHSTSVGAYDTITREDVANIQKSFEDKQDFLRIDAESRQPGGNTRFRVAVDPESQRLFDAAKERFGTTYDVREAGYILPDGTMLDFSGRHWTDDARDNSWLNGRRQVDHRDIQDINYERDGNTPTGLETDMSDFIRRGAIRISYPGSINLAKKPTWDQEEVLEKLIRMDNKFVRVDFGDGTSSDHYADYDYARPANVIDDIYEYFENGVKPNGDTRFREADSGNAATDYENEIRRTTTKILLEFQDADIPVRVAVNKIMNEVSKEHLEESEDYLTRHNLVSSRADAQMHKFKLFYYGPLMDTVGEIEDRLIERTSDDKPGKRARKAAYERIRNYIYAVSALERNAWKNDEADKNRKDALDDIEVQRRKKAADVEADSRLSRDEKDIAIEEVEKWAKKKRSEARRKYARRDWSGITALMGRPKDEWVEAEADAADMVSIFRTELGDEDMLKRLWDGIRACTDFNLEFAYKNGLLTRTEYERFHGTESQPRLWEYYVPLRGFAERTAEDEYSYNMLTNRDTKDTVLKNMKGRVTQADDPIANIRHIAEMGIVQGLNNWAKRALYEFVIDAGKNTLLTPVDYWYIKDDDGNWSPAEPEEDESLEDFEERMVGLMNEDEPRARKGRNGLKLSLLMGNKGHRNAHMIRLKVNGVDKGIWVNGDPVLAKAVNGTAGLNHRVIRGIQKVNRNLAQLYTTLSVKFITKNKMRDTQFSRIAALVGEDQAYLSALEKNWWANNGYVAAAAPMMKMVFDWESGKLEKKENLTEREQMFIDFMYDGGATGYTVMNTMEDIKKDLEKMVENAGSEQRTLPVIGLYAKWVGALNEGAELLTRFTFYQTSREMGRSRERAAYDAKESSVNFNRRGLRSGEGVIGFAAAATGLLYLFFNPAVQGLDKFVRLHKEHPWKMGIVDATYFMMGFVNSMLNAMIAGASDGGGGDDDDKMGPDWYWNIPEWVRRSNIIIGSPFKKLGKWGYLVISLPIEYKGFYAMGELASSLLQKRYAARDAATIANEVVGVVAELLPVNPVEGYTPGDNAVRSVLRNLTPGALAPIVDVANNRSFSGVPLWKENIYDETQPLSQSSFASTPEILNKAVIKLSDATATMPWHIDIPAGAVRGLLKGYGGGAYTFVEDLGKFVFADEAHPRRYENFPIVSGFTGYLEEDRRNSFNNNALQNYKELSKDVVTRIRSVAPEVDEKMVYEHPDDLPPKAKVAMVALKNKWILGQMYYNGIKERSGAMESRVNKRGDVYSASVDDSVKGLRSVWKKKKEEYAKLLEDKNANDQELDTARDAMLDAWSAYTDAEDSLVDKLLEEEYYHVQERLKNGIPYEPKRTLGERAYDLTNKKK